MAPLSNEAAELIGRLDDTGVITDALRNCIRNNQDNAELILNSHLSTFRDGLAFLRNADVDDPEVYQLMLEYPKRAVNIANGYEALTKVSVKSVKLLSQVDECDFHSLCYCVKMLKINRLLNDPKDKEKYEDFLIANKAMANKISNLLVNCHQRKIISKKLVDALVEHPSGIEVLDRINFLLSRPKSSKDADKYEAMFAKYFDHLEHAHLLDNIVRVYRHLRYQHKPEDNIVHAAIDLLEKGYHPYEVMKVFKASGVKVDKSIPEGETFDDERLAMREIDRYYELKLELQTLYQARREGVPEMKSKGFLEAAVTHKIFAETKVSSKIARALSFGHVDDRGLSRAEFRLVENTAKAQFEQARKQHAPDNDNGPGGPK